MLSSSSALFTQGLRSACRIAGRGRGRALCSYSMSSARAQEATGSHLFRIGGYTVVDKRYPTGEPVVSAPFLIGGREWELGFYPNGILSPASVGAVLRPRLGNVINSDARRPWGGDAVAEYTVSILDRAGNQVYGRSVGLRGFSYMSWGGVKTAVQLEKMESKSFPEGGVLGPAVVDLVSKEELRKALPHLLDDDSLCVRCDVTALDFVDMETTSSAVGRLST